MDLEKLRKVMDGRELIIEYNLISIEDPESMVLAGLRLFRDLGADIDLEEAVKKLSDGKKGGIVKFSFYGEQFEFARYNTDDDLEPVGSSISVTRIIGDKSEKTEEPRPSGYEEARR